jgi:hypothetical protein
MEATVREFGGEEAMQDHNLTSTYIQLRLLEYSSYVLLLVVIIHSSVIAP